MPPALEDRIRLIGQHAIVPPYCFEVYLRDGRSFFVHSVPPLGDESPLLTMRVWDLRELDDGDERELKEQMNKVGAMPEKESDLHPKLDWGILRVPIDLLAYHVEWHNRWWPIDNKEMGFHRAAEG